MASLTRGCHLVKQQKQTLAAYGIANMFLIRRIMFWQKAQNFTGLPKSHFAEFWFENDATLTSWIQVKVTIIETKLFALMSILLPNEISLGTGSAKKEL